MELMMTTGTNDSNAPPPSNKRLRATQPQQQESETSPQDGPADQPITPVENTDSLNTELEELREYKRLAEAKEVETARELENLQEAKRQQSAEVRTLKDAHEEAREAARTYFEESTNLREQVEAYRIAGNQEARTARGLKSSRKNMKRSRTLVAWTRSARILNITKS